MPISRTRLDLSEERRILSHMITSTDFLTQIHGLGEARLFESSFARTVASWVWEFYAVTKEAPSKAIEDIYRKKVGEIRDEALNSLISEYLSNLSQEWEKATPNNVQYSVLQATTWFKSRSLTQLKEKLESALAQADVKVAEKLIGDYKRIERAGGSTVDMMNPEHAGVIADAFASAEESLFRFPGALGEVIGPIIRGDFAGIVAPPKRGKSWFADYCAQRAAQCGLKTLVINLEMTREQMIRRRWQGLTGKLQTNSATVWIPEFIRTPTAQGSLIRYTVGGSFEERTAVGTPSTEEIQAIQKQLRMLYRNTVMHLECMNSGSFSPAMLRAYLQNAEAYQNILYDVVVVDAPYLMADDDNHKELRHRLDSINKGLRGIAQEFSLAMFVTHQGDASTMDGKRDVKAGSTSESKVGILSHYTKMLGLNQKEEEKKRGIMRVSCDITRDGEGTAGQAVVLQCLAIGHPYLDSQLLSRVDLEAAPST